MPDTMETFKEIFESHYTWIEGFMRNVRRYSYRTAIIMPEKNLWTYAELNREVNRLANALQQDGVRKGDIVMLQLLNCPEFVFSYVATQKLHAVTSPVSYRLSSGELAKNLKETNPKVLMFDECHRAALDKLHTLFPEKRVTTYDNCTIGIETDSLYSDTGLDIYELGVVDGEVYAMRNTRDGEVITFRI